MDVSAALIRGEIKSIKSKLRRRIRRCKTQWKIVTKIIKEINEKNLKELSSTSWALFNTYRLFVDTPYPKHRNQVLKLLFDAWRYVGISLTQILPATPFYGYAVRSWLKDGLDLVYPPQTEEEVVDKEGGPDGPVGAEERAALVKIVSLKDKLATITGSDSKFLAFKAISNVLGIDHEMVRSLLEEHSTLDDEDLENILADPTSLKLMSLSWCLGAMYASGITPQRKEEL